METKKKEGEYERNPFQKTVGPINPSRHKTFSKEKIQLFLRSFEKNWHR